MNPTFKNTLAVIAGMIGGSIVNMGIINIGSGIIPPPAGADVTSMEGLKASMHLFGPLHFLMPFLAHAIGTLVGAVIAIKLSDSKSIKLAYIIGAIFLIGGITNVLMLPSPIWFSLTDIILAYFPMAFLGGKLAGAKRTVKV